MRVLYGTDGSDHAREGERLIHSLFDPARCKIHVFTVRPEPLYVVPVVDGTYELERMDVPVFSADQIAAESAQRLSDAGFETSSSWTRGDPAREILHELKEDSHDLVVLGASHTTWMGNVLLGSVSMHVLHHSPRPIVVTHRAPSGSGRVLFATDGSEGANRALEAAHRVLDKTRCSFTIATVTSEPWLSTAVYPPGPPSGTYPAYRTEKKQRIEQAWDLVERTCFRLEAAGFHAEGSVLMGAAGPQILKEADNLQADLIVAGSRGLGPIKRSFIGSVSDQLVRHATATLIGRGKTT